MTPFRWVLLCVFFTLYLLFGGSIFMLIEQHHEIHMKEELHVLRQDIQEILFRLDYNFYNNQTSPDILDALTSAKEGVINRIAAVCGIDNLLDGAGRPEPSSLKWNYYNSVFFAFTVVTTIGYGHLSPSTSLSKSFMMLYALFGIPINGILLSGVGDYFSNKLMKVHQKSKNKHYRGKCTLIFEIVFYLIPGMVVFIIIPSGIFVLIENWSFLDSIYFAFVSLTTIGFGDYVAGMGDGHNIWLWLYKAFIIIWITFGLGYLIMILGFIAKGLKSKKVRGVLEKRLTGIRNTKEKLSKDIEYMTRIVNELYMMKVKPTYDLNEVQNQEIAETHYKSRSRHASIVNFKRRCSSLPRLQSNDGSRNVLEIFPSGPNQSSNFGSNIKNELMRRLSESDLDRIEVDKTFLSSMRQSATHEELLAHVVNTISENVIHEVMHAVDELNQYEQQVVAQHFHGEESPDEVSDHERRKSVDLESNCSSDDKSQKDYGTAPPWELDAVSESDEEVLLDEEKNIDKPEVVIHKVSLDETNRKGSQGQSFIDKVSGAIRKISGAMTPPETPSRKISRNESDNRGKISLGESEKPSPGAFTRSHHQNHTYSSFRRRSSARRPHSFTPELDQKMNHSKTSHRKPASDMRKISQESRISNISNSSYKTLDEIISSARTSRKTTPAPFHHPPYGDEVDANGKICPEATSLAHLLLALDNVQDRLKKSSSDYGASDQDSVDLSNSFATGSGAKPIDPRYRRSVTPPEGVDRRRKVGVFQPGFSYVNFGFSPDGDEEDVNANKGKQPPDKKEEEFSKSSNSNIENSTTSRRR
ncbi:unnamed protein product [Orchesella dallaii]|uniref:Potassium channel domain-containing protein n=1 Tax=Orchesella dallaii TaxID=48710 RepID=A0ABP1QSH8_9HEXA